MHFVEEKIIKKACYVLKGNGLEYFYINETSFVIQDKSGTIKKIYHIPNPSHFCFCEDSAKIALLNTTGNFYIVNTYLDSMMEIPICSGEGCSPVFLKNNLYWANWGGKIFKCDLSDLKIEVTADLSEQNVMIVDIDANNSKNAIVATLYSINDSRYRLLYKPINEKQFRSFELPIKKQGVISGVKCLKNNFILYESKSNLIYIFELLQNELTICKTISIPRKYGTFDGTMCVYDNLCAIQNRNYAVVLDVDKEEIVFELSERYISSVNLSNDKLYIGCWDKGLSFILKKEESLKV